MRPLFVWIHRYAGLAMALILIVEGLTGSLLAFRGDLTQFCDSSLAVRPPAAGAPKLDVATLIERAKAQEPKADLAVRWHFPGDAVIFKMRTRIDPTTGLPYDIGIATRYFYIALDPWTGREIKRLGYNLDTEGVLPNVVPIAYELHKSLLLGSVGAWTLGVTALIWSIDCFIAVYLTLPRKLRGLWTRWKTAWLVKWRAGPLRFNFDLHRAGGLWSWAMLFVFAWSSVALLDVTGAYQQVTGRLFTYPAPELEDSRAAPPGLAASPAKLDLHTVQRTGDKVAAEIASRGGFRVQRPFALYCAEDADECQYTVSTDRRFPKDQDLNITFDVDTGRVHSIFRTNTGYSAESVTNWLFSLHTIQSPVDYLAYRVLVAMIGIVVAVLSGTGIYIWWKKRSARRHARSRPQQSASI